mmetsp:Transcript_31942/g.75888  ORF Transcript_31942/g.75888 Transcript_31942/m.75888 type:complete len:379 (+) Transcript_31942:44-1180(+)|eukprot:CAMPEP_0180140772 /NCGR_PEP_ID=MMETSP0986-20121125/14455_1 /TAXON_ID=697907 /ORGANISM="non described non described, Strain CCMP2293" /LENGTH=378 /DNA_ID=CAMNT_0022083385 /DNA_START=39 /DNA_END=1175 /DNA_ORIENTATION=+
MDAIARMKVELETKKRRMAEISASQDSEAAAAPGAAVKKKYMTKGQAKQLQVELASVAKAGEEQDSLSPEKLKLLSPDKSLAETGAVKRFIPKDAVIQRLRDIYEPITLYGETDEERLVRLRKAELTRPDEDSELAGQKNYHNEEKKKQLQKLAQGDSSDEEDLTPEEKREKKTARLEKLRTAEEQATDKNDRVRTWIKRNLKEWEVDIGDLPEEYMKGVKGRQELSTFKQSKIYLKPLFLKLKKKSLEPDILHKINLIVDHCRDRQYLKAADQYILLSIGKAAWPMGVTQVGIHERSAREKIHSSEVAHILNDETQRKFIQSLKRLMTYAQNKYPPDFFSQALEPTCIDTHAPSMLAKLGITKLTGIMADKKAPESW